MARSRRAPKTETKKTAARKSGTRRATTRATSPSSGGAVTAVVVSDSYAWHEVCNDPSTPRHDAAKGDKITVSAAEFERSQEMSPKALAKTGSDKAKAVEAGEEPADESPLTKPDGSPVEPVDEPQ